MNTARNILRKSILSLNNGEGRKLANPVAVANNSMVGYGEIVAVCRWTKRGIAYAEDACGQLYSINELTEDDCEKILRQVEF